MDHWSGQWGARYAEGGRGQGASREYLRQDVVWLPLGQEVGHHALCWRRGQGEKI